MTKTQPQKNLIYLIELNVGNEYRKKYRFSLFEEACIFFYKNLKTEVKNITSTSDPFYNAVLFSISNNKKTLLVRKNLTKVYFDTYE